MIVLTADPVTQDELYQAVRDLGVAEEAIPAVQARMERLGDLMYRIGYANGYAVAQQERLAPATSERLH